MSSSENDYQYGPQQKQVQKITSNASENPGTFVKRIKNMMSDLLDSKKTEFKNGHGSSTPGEDIDGKVVMSDTDDNASQISPIQTFKVNQNRKQILVTHEDHFSPEESDQVGESSGLTHERNSVHQSIQGFISPNK